MCWFFEFEELTPINLIQLLFLTLKTLISTIWVKNHQRSSFFRNMKHPEMNFCLFSIHWPLFQIMVVLVFWIWRVNTDKFDPIAFLTLKTLISTIWSKKSSTIFFFSKYETSWNEFLFIFYSLASISDNGCAGFLNLKS